MIIPRFKLTQDHEFVTINIRAPYCSLGELQWELRKLHSTSDTDSGKFSYICPKKNKGEYFKVLDLITKLLTPRVEASYNDGSMPIYLEILSKGQESMEVASEQPANIDLLEYGFGFGLRVHKDFVHISLEFDEVFAIDTCKVGLAERTKLRLQYEQGKFNDVEHYRADFTENKEICELIAQNYPFVANEPYGYTDKELDFLKDLLLF